MKNLLLLSTLFLVTFSACTDDETTEIVVLTPQTVNNLPAVSTSRYTFYNLRTNAVVTDSASTNWDIAFRATAQGIPYILFNGGATGPGNGGGQIVDGLFDEFATAPTTGYATAVLTSGWYLYTGAAPTGPQHAVLPTAGKLFIIKTADGKYAKMQIISGYQGNPDTSTPAFANFATRPSFGYFTFKFVVQTNGTGMF